uniref:RNA cytidine acetyltransferase 2 n=1 Tax=Nicotiana tabacum TaxID=4097 RepID=A0A1S4D7K4_TOBAC|nr:PREDICTED: RNA cytidine acetyltransferase 2-like [Nicotiana tabacum]
MRKKVDERIRTLIENGVRNRHRSMFVIIGDKSRDQIVNLHYMLSKAVVRSRPTVLWCYKDKLELSSHKQKRKKQVKKYMQRGLLDPEKVEPFELFVETGGVSYCLYRDSERILGNTFGMCILQDFEALTPNLLARTIETVEGGGLIVLLIRTLSSLKSLCTMVMDVHDRFRTESHSQATPRFNERFILSLASCESCIVMDDELNILPISSHMKSITAVPVQEDSEGLSEAERELRNLKEQLNEDFPVGPLIRKCCTLDQVSYCA